MSDDLSRSFIENYIVSRVEGSNEYIVLNNNVVYDKNKLKIYKSLDTKYFLVSYNNVYTTIDKNRKSMRIPRLGIIIQYRANNTIEVSKFMYIKIWTIFGRVFNKIGLVSFSIYIAYIILNFFFPIVKLFIMATLVPKAIKYALLVWYLIF